MFSDSDKFGYYVIRRELVGWDQFHKEIESGSRARKYAAHSLNDDELRLDIGCLHDAVQRYRKRVSRRQPEDKVIDFIERAMPLIEDVAERDASFTPRYLPKLLE